jgi:hypothetical protein
VLRVARIVPVPAVLVLAALKVHGLDPCSETRVRLALGVQVTVAPGGRLLMVNVVPEKQTTGGPKMNGFLLRVAKMELFKIVKCILSVCPVVNLFKQSGGE